MKIKEMNKLQKFFLFLMIVIFSLLVVLFIWGSISGNFLVFDTNQKTEEKYITLEKFNKIKIGMTYYEVKEIIGNDGIVMQETGDVGTEYYHIVYYWYGKDGISNANFFFQNERLEQKTQIGLK